MQEPGVADIHDLEGIVQDHLIGEMRMNPAFRRGLESMDHVDSRIIFVLRVCVMKCVPASMKGSYQNAMRLTLQEADQAHSEDMLGLSSVESVSVVAQDVAAVCSPSQVSLSRLQSFTEGNWSHWLDASVKCAEQASQASRRRRRRQDDEVAKRADRVHSFVLSAARQALEGAAVASGTEATRTASTDPAKRPPVLGEPFPRHLAEAVLASRFDLDPVLFSQNLRSARRGAAGGPTGMTSEHLRPLLDDLHHMERFWRMGQELARAATPGDVVDAIRLGRITAGASFPETLSTVACAVAQQLNRETHSTVSIRRPPDVVASVSHAIQAMTDMDLLATVLSADCIAWFCLQVESSHVGRFALVQGGHSSPSF